MKEKEEGEERKPLPLASRRGVTPEDKWIYEDVWQVVTMKSNH